MKKPTEKQVKKYFCSAREVFCIKNQTEIGINGIKHFEWNEDEKSWTSIGGAVTFWSEGVGYAQITRKEKCADCPGCDKKKKNAQNL